MSRAAHPILREIADGVAWVGGCLVIEMVMPHIHSHMNAFVVRGSERTLMIDTGHPKDWDTLRGDLGSFLDGRSLDYVLPTHEEYPHAGNLPGLFEENPDLLVVGDTRDYHLYFPDRSEAFRRMYAGEVIDLGDRQLHILPAPLRDLPGTLWAYDSGSQTMFVSDGFTYSHEHLSGECQLLSGELERVPDENDILFANEAALHFTKFVDTDPIFDEIERLLQTYPTRFIAPAHGNVIDQPTLVTGLMKTQLRTLRDKARAQLAGAVSGDQAR